MPAAVVTLLFGSTRVSAQPTTVVTAAGAMHVRAPGFGFIEGPVLDRLKEGRSVHVNLGVAVLAQPGGPAVVTAEQRFTLSFDLWEERFAVAMVGPTQRSISHLRTKDAEAWCLERLTIRESELGRLGREAPFWIRLTYRAERVTAADAEEDAAFTLRGLIDRLSRRREDELGKSVESGPLRLSN